VTPWQQRRPGRRPPRPGDPRAAHRRCGPVPAAARRLRRCGRRGGVHPGVGVRGRAGGGRAQGGRGSRGLCRDPSGVHRRGALRAHRPGRLRDREPHGCQSAPAGRVRRAAGRARAAAPQPAPAAHGADRAGPGAARRPRDPRRRRGVGAARRVHGAADGARRRPAHLPIRAVPAPRRRVGGRRARGDRRRRRAGGAARRPAEALGARPDGVRCRGDPADRSAVRLRGAEERRTRRLGSLPLAWAAGAGAGPLPLAGRERVELFLSVASPCTPSQRWSRCA
jgi:hypothetical protein